MLDLLFDFFFGNEVNNEINDGNFTTNALNMTLFPNTYLFALNANKPNTPGSCCVLGFHTFFFDPSSSPATTWVTQYASWISPGIFVNPGFLDVTGLSHETSEAFNDPFVDNPTPSWQFPGVSAPAGSKQSRLCQNNLETGDPGRSPGECNRANYPPLIYLSPADRGVVRCLRRGRAGAVPEYRRRRGRRGAPDLRRGARR